MNKVMRWMMVASLMAVALSGCGGSTAATTSNAATTGGAANDAALTSGRGAAAGAARQPDAAVAPAAEGAKPASVAKSNVQNTVFANDPNHKIIKNGDLSVQVDNVTIAINRFSTVATANGGYILEVKSSDQIDQTSTATLTFAVPVDHFEIAMQAVRDDSKKVLSEHATGQDVSQEFVDVQSQIANLEATQARVKTFLEQAKTVEEALKVNTQLSDLEGQIGQLKGRLQFLSQRTAFSTITVQIQQVVGATPTPTAGPPPVPWHPADTVQAASATLRGIVQGIAQAAIWLGIVVLPLLVPLLLVLLLVRAMRLRRGRRGVLPPAATGDGPAGPIRP